MGRWAHVGLIRWILAGCCVCIGGSPTAGRAAPPALEPALEVLRGAEVVEPRWRAERARALRRAREPAFVEPGAAGVARSQIERINTEVTRLLVNPTIIDRMTKIGIEPQALSVPQFEKVLREDLERVERIVKLSGAKSE